MYRMSHIWLSFKNLVSAGRTT